PANEGSARGSGASSRPRNTSKTSSCCGSWTTPAASPEWSSRPSMKCSPTSRDWSTRPISNNRGLRLITRSRGQGHHESVSRAERRVGLGLNQVPRHQTQSVALGDHRQDQRPFHQGEFLPDAYVGTAEEREIRVPRPPGRVLREEAFGLGPELPVPVREVLAKEDGRAGRNRVPPDLVGLDGVANGGPDRRVEPYCLLDDAAGVIQRRQIVGAGVTAIEG